MSSESIIREHKEREIYFIVLIPNEKKIDFQNANLNSDIIPKIIHNKTILKENGSYLEEIVFKFKKNNKSNDKKTNPSNDYILKYIEGHAEYMISFSAKEKCFVYETELKKGNKYLDNIVKESIDQDVVSFHHKLNIFIEALQEKNEINNIENKLYEDTIALYEKKKNLVF